MRPEEPIWLIPIVSDFELQSPETMQKPRMVEPTVFALVDYIFRKTDRTIGASVDCEDYLAEIFSIRTDPILVAELADIVGLLRFAGSPSVLSLDEKSQIQALDRTQGGWRSSRDLVRDDLRLQAARQDHPICRAQRDQGHRHRAAALRTKPTVR
jgi:hypothetical protein